MTTFGAFLFGVFVGVPIGWLLLSLMIMASRAEEQLDKEGE